MEHNIDDDTDRSNLVNRIFKDVNLPLYCEDDSVLEIPFSLKLIIEEIERNGIEDLKNNYTMVAEFGPKIEKVLKKCRQILKDEQLKDEDLKDKFGSSWQYPDSREINESIWMKIDEGNEMLNNWLVKTEAAVNIFNENLGKMLILKSTKEEIQSLYIESVQKGVAFCDLKKLSNSFKELQAEARIIRKELAEADKVSLDVTQTYQNKKNTKAVEESLDSLNSSLSSNVNKQKVLVEKLEEKKLAYLFEKRQNNIIWQIYDSFEIFMEINLKVKDCIQNFKSLLNDCKVLKEHIKQICDLRMKEKSKFAKELEVQGSSAVALDNIDKIPKFVAKIKQMDFNKEVSGKQKASDVKYIVKIPDVSVIRPNLDIDEIDREMKSKGSQLKMKQAYSIAYVFGEKHEANEAFLSLNDMKDLNGIISMKKVINEPI